MGSAGDDGGAQLKQLLELRHHLEKVIQGSSTRYCIGTYRNRMVWAGVYRDIEGHIIGCRVCRLGGKKGCIQRGTWEGYMGIYRGV